MWQCHREIIAGLASCLLATANPASAQIVPDRTLPNNTNVIPNNDSIRIEGGTSVGNNLFHSFTEFSIPTGTEAFFNNSLNIQNILGRVTGGNSSRIDGLIRANGTANLFLINPAGIVFGPNAQLNLGGSFIGSSASSIRFIDGSEFSATNPQSPPLLTINIPIGLNFRENPGRIINQSQATSNFSLPPIDIVLPIPDNVGLEVVPGQTLALIGGDVILEGGNLTAFQGEIKLGSVAGPGFVSLTPTETGIALGYDNITDFGTIALSRGALVNASGLGGGAIALRGGNITLSQNANLIAATLGNADGRSIEIQAEQFKLEGGAAVFTGTFGEGTGASLTVTASDFIELTGSGELEFLERILAGDIDSSIIRDGLFSTSFSTGRSGDVEISTGRLILQDGAVIATGTFAAGKGGNLTIRASESIEFLKAGFYSGTTGAGNAGDLTIETQRIFARDGGQGQATTLGAGRGGNLTITATESVELIGTLPSLVFPDGEVPTGFFSSTFSEGAAGNVRFATRKLTIRDGASIAASSVFAGGRGGDLVAIVSDSVELIGSSETGAFRSALLVSAEGSEDAGNLSLETRRLIIREGGRISASTFGLGDGGDLTVIASESVELSGISADGRFPSGLFALSGEIDAITGIPVGTGAGGDLRLQTEKLVVEDGAIVTVSSIIAGDAGNLEIAADSILLNNDGSITADNQVGARGNIVLRVGDLEMRRGGRISTNAGSADGGNITIATENLAALENSDITANALEGAGGRVVIQAEGIFGTQFREAQTPESDITATSNLGAEFSGTVEITRPEVDPSSGFVELAENVVDPAALIARDPCTQGRGSEFVVTGRGGLPENPTQTLRRQAVWQDLRPVESERLSINNSPSATPSPSAAPSAVAVVPARGWIFQENGKVMLVGYDPTRTHPQRFPIASPTCNLPEVSE